AHAQEREENPMINNGSAFFTYVNVYNPAKRISSICTINIIRIATYEAIINLPKSINVAISLVAALFSINANIPYGVKRKISVTTRIIIVKITSTPVANFSRSEEHTSELQSRFDL